MGIAGVGANSYLNYGMQYPKNHSAKQSEAANAANFAPATLALHGDSETHGKVLGAIGFPDGSNTSVYKSQNYTADNPVFLVMTWDAEGNKTETEINAAEVNPANASLQEMLALNANRNLNGEESFGDELMMSAGRLRGNETTSGYQDFFSKRDWIAEMKDFMDMQYKLGSMDNYLRYKKAVEILQGISDTILNLKNASDKTENKDSVENDFSRMLARYGEQIKEKIKNGETEPTYQIGGQSFTEKEWKKLMEKIDRDIEQIQAEQAERAEKQKAEQADNVSNSDSDIAGIARYYNGKEVNYEEDMLHDRKIYDDETGVAWYLNDKRGPYMSEADSEKFDKWCEDNGVDRLKKFVEMTGLIRNYSDGTTAYIGDNGIAVKGQDGTEFVVEYQNVSWYAIMNAIEHMQENPLDKQAWNQIMQEYVVNKWEDIDVTENQLQQLLTDTNERGL